MYSGEDAQRRVCVIVCVCIQVLWMDADTLWLDSMANMKGVFRKFAETQALFGMVVETTHVKSHENWYKALQGRRYISIQATCIP